jgi:hypothetical protein
MKHCLQDDHACILGSNLLCVASLASFLQNRLGLIKEHWRVTLIPSMGIDIGTMRVPRRTISADGGLLSCAHPGLVQTLQAFDFVL